MQDLYLMCMQNLQLIPAAVAAMMPLIRGLMAGLMLPSMAMAHPKNVQIVIHSMGKLIPPTI